jgi:hypothetical protein
MVLRKGELREAGFVQELWGDNFAEMLRTHPDCPLR